MRVQHLSLWGSVLAGIVLALLIVAGGIAVASQRYRGAILPGVSVGNLALGGLTPEAASEALEEEVSSALTQDVEIVYAGVRYGTQQFLYLGTTVNVDEHIARAYAIGRSGSWRQRLTVGVRGLLGTRLPLHVRVQENRLRETLTALLGTALHEPVSAGWAVNANGELTFRPSAPGRIVHAQDITQQLSNLFLQQSPRVLSVQTIDARPLLSDSDVKAVRPTMVERAQQTLTFMFEGKRWEVPQSLSRTWIVVVPGTSGPLVTFDAKEMAAYIEREIAPAIRQSPENARFVLVDGRVTLFQPPKEGRVLNTSRTVEQALRLAQTPGADLPLIVERDVPPIPSTTELDRLGIQTLLARGESDFRGSPRNRIHNIRVGAERFHGLLIPPGATFAFNEHLGPITHATGYKPELVILHNVTTPQYGGGLCQVSTTAFRAAILSGLKITERKNHAYPVAYYGTPGFDATIYPNQRTWRDGTDLKFVNDTPAHILIQTRVEGTTLIFEFWGTVDGREVAIVGPTPYGRKPDGSLRATLTQKVLRQGALVREETFQSTYKSARLFPHALAINAEGESWEARVKRIAEKDRKAQEVFNQKAALEAAEKSQKATPSPLPVETDE